MNCLNCAHHECKTAARDCTGSREEVVGRYGEGTDLELYRGADRLVSGGKAGTLSRVEEIMAFAVDQGYRNLAIAYCYSLEDLASMLMGILREKGFGVTSVRCTVHGIREDDIMGNGRASVNCNPIGQAETLNRGPADLVIEMGLCLGHDVIFHRHVEKPFTVLIVKDRVYDHDPKRYLLR